MKKIIYTFFALLILSANSVTATPQHGLSLYGPQDLKYKAGQPYDYANPKAPKGGNLVLADFGAFTKLNPASLKGVTAPGIGMLVYQTAMDSSADENEAFSQYGSLVEKAELAENHLSLTYYLYKQAKFSDGHPLTADDFIFSFNLVKDPQYHPIFKEYFKDIKSIERIDTHTVRYHFAVRNQELPLITGQMIIFPKHIKIFIFIFIKI